MQQADEIMKLLRLRKAEMYNERIFQKPPTLKHMR